MPFSEQSSTDETIQQLAFQGFFGYLLSQFASEAFLVQFLLCYYFLEGLEVCSYHFHGLDSDLSELEASALDR